MTKTDDEMKLLSQLFRDSYSDLESADQRFFVDMIQTTFAIKNRRNVELWVTSGNTKRDFINGNVSELEMEMRMALLKGLISPDRQIDYIKSRSMEGTPQQAGIALRKYLLNDYTRGAVYQFQFINGVPTYTYDGDISGDMLADDLDSDEWSNYYDQ